jgi:hypothetical protein
VPPAVLTQIEAAPFWPSIGAPKFRWSGHRRRIVPGVGPSRVMRTGVRGSPANSQVPSAVPGANERLATSNFPLLTTSHYAAGYEPAAIVRSPCAVALAINAGTVVSQPSANVMA